MPETLLRTKLAIPPLRPGAVSRPRLIETLNHGLSHGARLSLVAAPAGYGKTTLVLAWIAGLDRRVAWLALDEGDNDPARFFAHLRAALQSNSSAPATGFDQPAVVSSPAAEALITTLFNDISSAPEPLVLILDDYHLIENPAIHGGLAFLLDHQPQSLHVVIASRADPPLPLSRLRGRGQVCELRAADLRFSTQEASLFLSQTMGLSLSAAEVSALEENTEGWVAGLQLAALSMQGRDDHAGFITAFSGNQEYVADFLIDEVLQEQAERMRVFLLQTSILDQLTGDLCDAVTGDQNGQQTLRELKRANLFLASLDHEQHWYRYHRLFAEVLRARLAQSQPGILPDLHRRASLWHEQNGFVDAAIKHSLLAQDVERAAGLVEANAEGTMMRGEMATLTGWLSQMPAEIVQARPQLAVYKATALLVSGGSPEAVEEQLSAALKSDSATISGQALVVRCWLAGLQGEALLSADYARRALEELPEDNHFWRTLAAANRGLTQLWTGDSEAGIQAMEDALRVGQSSGNAWLTTMATRRIAKYHSLRGQYHEARALHELALGLAVDQEGRYLPVAGISLIELGELWREWNELEKAAGYLEQGIELVALWAEMGALRGYISLAFVRQAQGDTVAAQQAIQEALEIARRTTSTEIDDLGVAMYQAQLFILQGDLAAAGRWAASRQLLVGGDAAAWPARDPLREHPARKHEQLVLAQLLVAQNRHRTALVLLDDLLVHFRDIGQTALVMQVQSQRALALQALGDEVLAMASLQEALALAQPGGAIRYFVNLGRPMNALLYQAATQGVMPAYTARLLAAFPPEDETPRTGAALVEPLSRRELEVLGLMADGASNQEIAVDLVIAVSTVKKHVSHIFGKLGVTSRTQAVAKARTLGLIN